MATVTLNPRQGWHSFKQSTTYNTAAGATSTNDPSGGTNQPYCGQEKEGTTYRCWIMHLAFTLPFTVNDTVTGATWTWDMDDYTVSQIWDMKVRKHTTQWTTGGNPSSSNHYGQATLANHTRVFQWSMAGTADDPNSGEEWNVAGTTPGNIVEILNTLIDAGTTELQLFIHSDRHESLSAPSDQQMMRGATSLCNLNITYDQGPNPNVTASFAVPGATLSVTPAPIPITDVAISFEIPAPTLTVTDNGGPLDLIDFQIPAPELFVTSARGYNRDSLYGAILSSSRWSGDLI